MSIDDKVLETSHAHELATQGEPAGISMHDNVPVWYDCCSCEAEPYWVEALSQPEGAEE